MTSDNIHDIGLARRLKHLEHFVGSSAGREGGVDATPAVGAPAVRVIEPRRSRVFLRHGAGHGVFAELTLTAPRPRTPRA